MIPAVADDHASTFFYSTFLPRNDQVQLCIRSKCQQQTENLFTVLQLPVLFKRQHDASLDRQKDGTSEIWPQEETVTPFNFSLLGFKCKLCCNCCYYYCILYLSFFTEWLIVVSTTLPVTEKWRRYRFLLQFVPKNKQKKTFYF